MKTSLHLKKKVAGILILAMAFSLSACGSDTETQISPISSSDLQQQYPNACYLTLKGNEAELNGEKLTEYNYVWNYDPSMEEPEYTGDEPDSSSCYIAHDIVYYPEVDASAFSLEKYDGETEWVTHYTAEGLTDYLFGTLPVSGDALPEEMMHSAEEAYDNPVLHITQPGEYVLEGTWNGQIYIDLGDEDECFTDESKKVTLILNGADVTCTVAPSVIFRSLYECDNLWEERSSALTEPDLSDAGARVILVDGTENNFIGTNVYRLLKPKYKSDETTVQKKLYKTDGAFYSYVSMLIEGRTGILNITSGFEGLDTELHLTINGGYINIVSQNDGINVNEDHISVFTMNDGHLAIFAGQGTEGDVVDSNGYINMAGGVLMGASPSISDNVLDSDDGTTVSDEATVISNTSDIRGGTFGPGQGEFGQGKPERDGTFDGNTPPGRPEGFNGNNPPEGFDGNTPPAPPAEAKSDSDTAQDAA